MVTNVVFAHLVCRGIIFSRSFTLNTQVIRMSGVGDRVGGGVKLKSPKLTSRPYSLLIELSNFFLRLDQELDFIMAQQQELEEMLKPLEEAVSTSNSGSRQLQQADKERDFT